VRESGCHLCTVHVSIGKNLVGFLSGVIGWAEATTGEHVSNFVQYSTTEEEESNGDGASLIQSGVHFEDL
jgi:hypothetical protein